MRKVQDLILKCGIGIKFEGFRATAVAALYYTKANICRDADSGSFSLFSLMQHRHG